MTCCICSTQAGLLQEGGRAAPRLQLLWQTTGSGAPALAPNLFKRVLELLAYLIRSNERLATTAVCLHIPEPGTAAPVTPDTRGKQRAGEAADSDCH